MIQIRWVSQMGVRKKERFVGMWDKHAFIYARAIVQGRPSDAL